MTSYSNGYELNLIGNSTQRRSLPEENSNLWSARITEVNGNSSQVLTAIPSVLYPPPLSPAHPHS